MKRFFIGLFFILLTACASQPVTHSTFYTLPVIDTPTDNIRSDKTVFIRPIILADFLSKNGVVLQLDDITVHSAQYHQWAESLAAQLSRGLRDRLQAAQSDYRIVNLPSFAKQSSYQLQVEFDQFQGRFDGQAVTSGQWQLLNKQGETVTTQRFSLTQALPAEGYPVLIRALANNLDTLATDIASTLPRVDD
ncbi:PqiC family protein [Methylophaga sp.]|uniref:PqiC family protein n=1 Tax=Methylophaga sp. TaxID=2024840 RepID=UPI003A9513AF